MVSLSVRTNKWYVNKAHLDNIIHGGNTLRHSRDDELLVQDVEYPVPACLQKWINIFQGQRIGVNKGPARRRRKWGKPKLKYLGSRFKALCYLLSCSSTLGHSAINWTSNMPTCHTYKDVGLICVMETWLDKTISETQLSLSGLSNRDIVNSCSTVEQGAGSVCTPTRLGAGQPLSLTLAAQVMWECLHCLFGLGTCPVS